MRRIIEAVILVMVLALSGCASFQKQLSIGQSLAAEAGTGYYFRFYGDDRLFIFFNGSRAEFLAPELREELSAASAFRIHVILPGDSLKSLYALNLRPVVTELGPDRMILRYGYKIREEQPADSGLLSLFESPSRFVDAAGLDFIELVLQKNVIVEMRIR